jgi:hypothetical protein
MPQGSWAYITFVDSPGGHPDAGLPGGPPTHPGNRPPGSWGGPVDPGWGGGPPLHPGHRPPGSGEHPSHGLPGGGHGSTLPVWPVDGEHPIAPPSPGHPLPPIDPPPGTIWPPLPPGTDIEPGQKALVLVLIEGVGYRYVVIEMGDSVDNELPGEGEEGPDNTLPGQPGHPANRPPGAGAPPRPDAGLPPAPVRPGTPLPPTAAPKPVSTGRR